MGKQNIFHHLSWLTQRRSKAKPSSSTLLDKIQTCATLEEVKTLLLSKEVVLDEQLMAAFDKRIAELEEQTGTSFIF
jgi:hypothetical protein